MQTLSHLQVLSFNFFIKKKKITLLQLTKYKYTNKARNRNVVITKMSPPSASSTTEENSPTTTTNETSEETTVDDTKANNEKTENNNDHDDNDDQHHSLPTVDGVEMNRVGKVDWNERLSTAAGVAGNVMEWFDFAVFGYFSDIIADLFFPKQTGDSALVESFLVFGTGFLMRPIGGLLLGYIGDKYGRKHSLEHSIFIMALSTFLMGCLPTFDQIGYGSTVLLVFIRLMQGMSVGGQLMSSMVFTLERKPKDQWGYYGAVVMSTATMGTLIGGILAYIIRETLSEDDLLSWGWRIPFFFGCLVVIPGWYLKYRTDNTPVPTEGAGDATSNPESNPIKEMWNKEYRSALVSASMIVAMGAGGFYLTYVWMGKHFYATCTSTTLIFRSRIPFMDSVIYMETILDPPVEHAFAVNSCSLFFSALIGYPYFGWLSDRIGRYKLMVAGGILSIFTGPIALVMVKVGDPTLAFFAQLFLGSGLAMFGAPSNAWIVENFPVSVRLTALSVAYNLTVGVIGGFTPAIATLLVDHVSKISPGFFISLLALVSLYGLHISPREGSNDGPSGSGEIVKDGIDAQVPTNEIV